MNIKRLLRKWYYQLRELKYVWYKLRKGKYRRRK